MSRHESFRSYAFRAGVWPPIQGAPIDEAFMRLGEAMIEYVDATVTPQPVEALENRKTPLADANSKSPIQAREE